MKSRQEIEEAVEAQKAYCEENNIPHFAPNDGICWNCRKQIYDKTDGKSHVTHCQHCNKSYCD